MRILHDRVLVKPITEEKTKGGIILGNTEEPVKKGEVILIGEKVTSIKVGDTVQYHKFAGIEIDYHGERHLFLSENNDCISID